MTPSSKTLMITSFYVDLENVEAVKSELPGERLYASPDGEVVFLTAGASAGSLAAEATSPKAATRETRLAKHLKSDWRRQIVGHVEDVRTHLGGLEASRYLQIRYIEVPRSAHDAYLEWREQTIFKHVRGQDEIESFIAYHTQLSAKPGVVFLAGFSCAPERYLASFSTPHYLDIVRQAGDKYIFGGQQGLSTKVYERL